MANINTPNPEIKGASAERLLHELTQLMGVADATLPGRIKALEQRMDSFMSVLGRMFDLDWNKPDDRQVLINIREAIVFSAKIQSMRDPSFDQLVEYLKKSMKNEDVRARNVMSYIRLIIAACLGIISTVIVTRLGLK